MQRKIHYLLILLSGLFLLPVISLTLTGCDSVLPEEFTDKEYSSSAIDTKASSILAADTTGFYLVPNPFYVVNAFPMASLVDTATLSHLADTTLTEQQVFIQQFDGIFNTLIQRPLLKDSLNIVQTVVTQSVNYAAYRVTSSGDYYFYVSLIYSAANSGEYASIQVIKSDGSFVTLDNTMSMETVSSGTEEVIIPGGSRLVPTIKGKYRAHLDAGDYIVRMQKSSAANIGPYIKIVIL